jgi:hypothetical protein
MEPLLQKLDQALVAGIVARCMSIPVCILNPLAGPSTVAEWLRRWAFLSTAAG